MPFHSFGQSLCGNEAPWFLNLFDFSTAPELLYYSYIPIIAASLLIGIYVFLNNRRSLQGQLLLVLTLFFVLWVLNILVQWVASYHVVLMYAWQLTAIFEVGLYLSGAYFAYLFFFKKDLPYLWKLVFAGVSFAVLALTPTAYNVASYDLYNCEGSVGILWNAIYVLEVTVIVVTVVLGIIARHREKDRLYRKEITLLTIGMAIFLSAFFASNYYGEMTKIYEFNFWGPLGMFLFIVLLGYMIIELKAFNTKLLGAQAIVAATVILVASQYFFVDNAISYWLVTGTLLTTLIFGYFLVKGVQREVAQRIRIENLAKELDTANKQQIILIHFITHQIKGFVSKSRNIFSMMREGDFGPVPEAMKPMVEEGLRSDTKGVNTIQEILNAANIKSGKVSYRKEPFDLKALVDEIAHDLTSTAKEKGLSLVLNTGTEPLIYPGDKVQLTNALKNLIDNSIKYTPKGEVRVTLSKEGSQVRFIVEDTGVGITKEDMAHLFTEGGHGANSTKVNVESTGFGLYIVKNIIEAHDGKVWAESEGEGKGSRFIAELPV